MNERTLKWVIFTALLLSGATIVTLAEIERKEGKASLRSKGFGASSHQHTFSQEDNEKNFQMALMTKFSGGGILILLSGLTLYLWKEPTQNKS